VRALVDAETQIIVNVVMEPIMRTTHVGEGQESVVYQMTLLISHRDLSGFLVQSK
jgi:hypothetical protein